MWSYLKNHSIHKVALLILVDLLIIFLALYASYLFKFFMKSMRIQYMAPIHRINLFFPVVIFSHILFLYLYGMYSIKKVEKESQLFLYVLYSIATSTGLIMVVQFFFPGYLMGRVVLIIQLPLCTIGIFMWRTVANRTRISEVTRRNLALVGPGPLIMGFLKDAKGELFSHYRICGLYLTSPAGDDDNPHTEMKAYGSLKEMMEDEEIDAVGFQAMDPALDSRWVHAILRRACEGIEARDLITLYKNLTGRVPIRYLEPGWLLSYVGMQGGPSIFYLKVKRLIDLTVSSLLLIIFSPLMLLVAVLIKLDSRGPVFFRQERLGQNRKTFNCLKFRTMVEDAEEDTGPVWSSPDDPRVTAVGRWLRRFRLDELPQLINVIRGEMSLIGPRPIRKHFADKLASQIPLYELRFAMKPGLTGWSQVNHPYADSDRAQVEKFEYELFYIQNASLLIDGLILIKTLRTMFLGTGQ
jgi:exopolysaccharide biosynthesis polyprenyl glycosylphosphotransferase